MLKIINSSFIKSAIKKTDYPSLSISEFAFFGRSNSGKSSLINFILNRKALVKVGSMPGKTRMVNFFLIEAQLTEQSGNKKSYLLHYATYQAMAMHASIKKKLPL